MFTSTKAQIIYLFKLFASLSMHASCTLHSGQSGRSKQQESAETPVTDVIFVKLPVRRHTDNWEKAVATRELLEEYLDRSRVRTHVIESEANSFDENGNQNRNLKGFHASITRSLGKIHHSSRERSEGPVRTVIVSALDTAPVVASAGNELMKASRNAPFDYVYIDPLLLDYRFSNIDPDVDNAALPGLAWG